MHEKEIKIKNNDQVKETKAETKVEIRTETKSDGKEKRNK
jgi:hypothetical protein